MKSITLAQLEALLRGVRGATAVTIVALTLVALPRSGHKFVNRVVRKRSRRNCMIGFRYENSVNRQRDREGTDPNFVAQRRKWGKHVPGTPLVEHKGGVYLETKVERELEQRYEVDGVPVSAEEIEALVNRRSARAIPATADPLQDFARDLTTIQGVKRPVILRDFALESIIQLRMGGEWYAIEKAG